MEVGFQFIYRAVMITNRGVTWCQVPEHFSGGVRAAAGDMLDRVTVTLSCQQQGSMNKERKVVCG